MKVSVHVRLMVFWGGVAVVWNRTVVSLLSSDEDRGERENRCCCFTWYFEVPRTSLTKKKTVVFGVPEFGK